LRKDGEQTLRRTVIGRDKRGVGVQNADESEAGEIVAFCEQLRADQDIGFAALDALQRARELCAAPRAVAVDAHDARAGNAAASVSSTRCVPRPIGFRSTLPQVGQARGMALSAPQ